MAVAAKPEIARILLDLGIDPVDVYAVDNAEQTYIAALVEGINTLEVANKGESPRSRILRDELKGVREKKRKVRASKLFTKTSIVPVNKIKPQSLLPPSADDSPSEGKGVGNILNGILNILRLGNKQDKKESSEDRKERQRQRREKRESAIESLKGGTKKAASAGKKAVSSLISPFKNMLDGLINFLKVTLLGTLINGALHWFSKEENQRKITNLGRFFKDWWPSLLAGFLLFFTPIGTLVSATATLLAWAIPTLAALAKNPLIVGAALFSAGKIAPELFPDLVKDEADTAIDDSVNKQGSDKTITDLKEQQEKRGPLQRIGDFITGAGAEREEQIQKLETGEEKKFGFFREIKPKKMNEGGIVPAPYPVDNVLGTVGLTDAENTPPIITGYNKGGVVPGMGNKDTVPAMLTPGELVIPKNLLEGPTNPTNVDRSFMTPVKSTARTPVGTPVKVKSMSTTTVLPTIKKPKPTQRIREGSTIPVFRVASKSNAREITIRSLGIEEAL